MNVINHNLVKAKSASIVSSLLVWCAVTGMLTGHHGNLLFVVCEVSALTNAMLPILFKRYGREGV